MIRSAREEQEVRTHVMELLHEAERCTLAHLLKQAEMLLAEAWTIAANTHPDLANRAAWESALLLVRRGAYTEAVHWFGRMSAAPGGESALWPDTRQALMLLCQSAARDTAPPAGREHQSALRPTATLDVAPAQSLPVLKVTNLGHFQIMRGGEMLPVCKTYNAIGIFRYLLSCRHHAAHKEDLLEQFWPQARPNRAAHSLHVAVSGLRQYLNLDADSYVLFDHGQYVLNPAAVIEDDCHLFEELCDEAERSWRAGDLGLAQHAYAGVIACYQGDYALGDPDLPWAIARRERLRVRYLSALGHLGQIFVKHEHLYAAVDCYQRLLECDEYREDAHYQVMRCYAHLGRRAEALRQYERCVAVLARDLGLEPMVELQDLYRALLVEHQPSLDRGRRDQP